MTSPTDVKHIVRDSDVYGGRPCVAGHRISVHDIAVWHQQGETAEEIARSYGLMPAEVHAALVYYYDHQAEVDREIMADQEEIAARAAADTSPLAQRLREARDTRSSSYTDAARLPGALWAGCPSLFPEVRSDSTSSSVGVLAETTMLVGEDDASGRRELHRGKAEAHMLVG